MIFGYERFIRQNHKRGHLLDSCTVSQEEQATQKMKPCEMFQI
jgi:hypothetical protein